MCLHCGTYISAEAVLSGVRNRNHCPHCLSSRHLDLFEAEQLDRFEAAVTAIETANLLKGLK